MCARPVTTGPAGHEFWVERILVAGNQQKYCLLLMSWILDPASLVVNTKQYTQGKRLSRSLTYFVVLPKLCLHIYREVSFLLRQLLPPLSVVHLVVLLLGGAVLLAGCACGGVANNEVATGLCQLSKQF